MSLLDALITKDFSAVYTALQEGESPNILFESDVHIFGPLVAGLAPMMAYNHNRPMTPLTYAIETRLEDIALLLLEYGAEPNPEGVFIQPLNLACKHGLEHVVEKLLEKNARIDSEDYIHQVPILEAIKAPILERERQTGELTQASMKTLTNIVTALIRAGVKLNREDNRLFDDKTPIYQAAKSDRWSAKQKVDLLMELGATIHLNDTDGITFLEYLADENLECPDDSLPSLWRNYGREPESPQYTNQDPMQDGPAHITAVLERLLRHQQHEEIRQLAAALEHAEVTDKRAQALSIVRPRLFSARRAMERRSFDHGGINHHSILSSSYVSFFLSLREQSLFARTCPMMWRGHDDSKEDQTTRINQPHSPT